MMLVGNLDMGCIALTVSESPSDPKLGEPHIEEQAPTERVKPVPQSSIGNLVSLRKGGGLSANTTPTAHCGSSFCHRTAHLWVWTRLHNRHGQKSCCMRSSHPISSLPCWTGLDRLVVCHWGSSQLPVTGLVGRGC